MSTNPWGYLPFPSPLSFPFPSLPFPSLPLFPLPSVEVGGVVRKLGVLTPLRECGKLPGCYDDWPAFKNADTEDEREEQFVLLEQRPADVAVDAAREVHVENFTALRQVVTLLAHDDRLATDHSVFAPNYSQCRLKQEAQLSQRGRATLHVVGNSRSFKTTPLCRACVTWLWPRWVQLCLFCTVLRYSTSNDVVSLK